MKLKIRYKKWQATLCSSTKFHCSTVFGYGAIWTDSISRIRKEIWFLWKDLFKRFEFVTIELNVNSTIISFSLVICNVHPWSFRSKNIDRRLCRPSFYTSPSAKGFDIIPHALYRNQYFIKTLYIIYSMQHREWYAWSHQSYYETLVNLVLNAVLGIFRRINRTLVLRSIVLRRR